jgi:tRNA uridine 5-carboxymethylaminomethyl modification enzyme
MPLREWLRFGGVDLDGLSPWISASEALPLGETFPYESIPGLSREMVERLTRARPTTLAAAGRVPGVTPAALAALLVHARRLAA